MAIQKDFVPLGQRDPEELIGIGEVARALGTTRAGIYTARTRNPGKVPPPATPPRASPILWRAGTVLAHCHAQEQQNREAWEMSIARVRAAKQPPAKRGRPYKADQVKRRLAMQGGG